MLCLDIRTHSVVYRIENFKFNRGGWNRFYDSPLFEALYNMTNVIKIVIPDDYEEGTACMDWLLLEVGYSKTKSQEEEDALYSEFYHELSSLLELHKDEYTIN